MTLIEYITTLMGLHEDPMTENRQAQINEFREAHKEQVATFDDVETAIQVMIGSVLRDQMVGEQVQGVFNESILEILQGKGIITEQDKNNVAEIMMQATMELTKNQYGGQ